MTIVVAAEVDPTGSTRSRYEPGASGAARWKFQSSGRSSPAASSRPEASSRRARTSLEPNDHSSTSPSRPTDNGTSAGADTSRRSPGTSCAVEAVTV